MAPANSSLRKPLLALLLFILGAAAAVLAGFYMWFSFFLLTLAFSIACIGIFAFACQDLLAARGLPIDKCTGLAGLCAVIAIFLLGLTIVPTIQVGVLLRDQWFLSKLPDFQRSADTIEKTLPFDANHEIGKRAIPEDAKPPLPHIVSGRDSRGIATIIFITGFHEGYMYRSNDTPWKDSNWMRVRRHLAPNWFSVYGL